MFHDDVIRMMFLNAIINVRNQVAFNDCLEEKKSQKVDPTLISVGLKIAVIRSFLVYRNRFNRFNHFLLAPSDKRPTGLNNVS